MRHLLIRQPYPLCYLLIPLKRGEFGPMQVLTDFPQAGVDLVAIHVDAGDVDVAGVCIPRVQTSSQGSSSTLHDEYMGDIQGDCCSCGNGSGSSADQGARKPVQMGRFA
ncbi:hypothetical protein [Chthonobacter albigriseus]|uniref:hypothetical protein n=1 Tax=Chthonobacter albigriseus TaxID=1683161 RepID=UPI0015EE5471